MALAAVDPAEPGRGAARSASRAGCADARTSAISTPPPGPGPGNVAAVDLSGQPTDAGDLVGAGDTSLRSILPQARGVAVPPWPDTPQPAPAYQGGGIGGDWRFPTAVAPGQGGIGSDARFPLASPPGSPSATPKPTGPLATPGGGGATMKRTPGAPNLGYYQGNNNRFIGIAQPNASPQNSMRAGPQATALNLAGMFGGRGQPAPAPVNPNVPAANAQPVSSASPPPAAQSNAPMPPIMPGRHSQPARGQRRPQSELVAKPMSYREPDLFGEFQILQGIHRWNTNFNTEMTALVSALGSDTTTHDLTIETRAPALTFGLNQTRAQNDALLFD